ncbi:protein DETOXIFICATION 51-like [Chenopodium quinoa]|uniref:protein DETOXIFICATION 51-like n=1 Tax=Chenopodium quinoa TaxID=63459 RepID=UPI000B76FF9E|nr:protein DETOXIFICATION 51-like [Chenopodium quinoa]
MCNPPENNQILTISKTPPQYNHPPQHSNIYLDLLSLTNKNDDAERFTSIGVVEVGNVVSGDSGSDHNNNNDPSLLFPTVSDVLKESSSLFYLAFPILLTNLILYSRSMMSMVFLGRIGDAELAAGSLAIAFANITGYSVFSGLALGMEPLCSQAFGACRPKLLSLTLQRCVIFLLVCCLPISVFWLNMSSILGYLHQDPNIGKLAHIYITFCLPDLFTYSFHHPIKIYLRAQGITHPVTYASLVGAILHFPIMFFLVVHLDLGIAGVAVSNSVSNLVSLGALVMQVWLGGLHSPTWSPPSRECLKDWWPLVRLAGPSCVSVCLEWWWYEIMIVLCGLLPNPKASVASMGVLIQTTGLIYNFPASLSNAVSTRVGNELGAGRPKQAKLSGFIGITWAAIMGLTAMMFAYGARNVWARMFTGDVEILALTAAALPILGLCELGNCPQTIACGVVRGSARPATAANVNLGAFYMVGTPIAVGLAFYLGVGFCGLWIGLLSAQICCAGLLLYVVGTTDWDYQAQRAHLLTQIGGPAPSLELTTTVDSSLVMIHDEADRMEENDPTAGESEPLISISVT